MISTTAPTKVEIADVLDKAIEVIDRVGWHRGYLYDEEQCEEGTAFGECRVDMLGAINTAVTGSPLLGVSKRRLEDRIALADATALAVARYLKIPAIPRQIAWWNDELERTADDVRNAFRDTAAELRAEAAA
ncbi:DUF6197 family protein [Streptomyces sp. BA2]|uniref:DUF6197 family protein n=1 Tax=Streptomyces sp. BA2 TaxID=436595 RepID=UPI001329F34D|nr:hypothetical protein [Streptomyces sp. BA2]MWA08833.1 hypothetical protein [Streptomyces sp. BA2]